MSLRALCLPLILSSLLLACGGDQAGSSGGNSQVRLLSQGSNSGSGADSNSGSSKTPITINGPRDNYTITTGANGITITDNTGSQAPITVAKDARLRFEDSTVALDTSGNAGKAYRLYKAAFNRAPDDAGLAYWIDRMDKGDSADQISANFINSDEFKATYGTNASNLDVVKKIYQNVLHREGETSGVDYWVGVLDGKKATLAQVLNGFSESSENQTGTASSTDGGITVYEKDVSYKPKAVPGASRTVAVNDMVTLDGTGSAATGVKAVLYQWTMTSKPSTSTSELAGATTAQPSFLTDVAGVYEVSLVVSDGTTSSSAAKVSITASAQGTPSELNKSIVQLKSESGDPIGGGKSYAYTLATSAITVTSNAGIITVNVVGDQTWSGSFSEPNSPTKVASGSFQNGTRYPDSDATKTTLSWSGEGRGCNTLTGSFVVEKVSYVNDQISALDLRFDQYCDGATAPLRGRIHWSAFDTTAAPGPIAIPSNLWKPDASKLPTSGNYIYLESTAGDSIGNGENYNYNTSGTNSILIAASGNQVTVTVDGWEASFHGMSSLPNLQEGYYGGLSRDAFRNPKIGGMEWSGKGRGCNSLTGWMAVDKATYTKDVLTALDLRFEQKCGSSTGVLHGAIHWVKP